MCPPIFRYEIVKPEKMDQALELLYATYHPDEPLTKHLGQLYTTYHPDEPLTKHLGQLYTTYHPDEPLTKHLGEYKPPTILMNHSQNI